MRLLTLFTALFAMASLAQASSSKIFDSEIPGVAVAGTIFIAGAWTRQSPPGVKVGSAYLRIRNNGETADRLLGGEVEYAERIEIHKMEMKEGVMSMGKIKGGITIDPGETAVFKPGSYHLMIIGMEKAPMAGDVVTFMLEFEKAGLVNVLMPVAPIGAKEYQPQ